MCLRNRDSWAGGTGEMPGTHIHSLGCVRETWQAGGLGSPGVACLPEDRAVSGSRLLRISLTVWVDLLRVEM